jgi:hypothetical protein
MIKLPTTINPTATIEHSNRSIKIRSGISRGSHHTRKQFDSLRHPPHRITNPIIIADTPKRIFVMGLDLPCVVGAV